MPSMVRLYHHPFCAHSRFARLILGEFGIEPELIEENVWERRRDFLRLTADGATPVLVEATGTIISGGQVIAEYLDEELGAEMGERRLMPRGPVERAEVRRLMAWFNVKLFNEATNWLATEKIAKRFMPTSQG